MQLFSFGELENFHAVREQHEEFGQHELKKHIYLVLQHIYSNFSSGVLSKVLIELLNVGTDPMNLGDTEQVYTPSNSQLFTTWML